MVSLLQGKSWKLIWNKESEYVVTTTKSPSRNLAPIPSIYNDWKHLKSHYVHQHEIKMTCLIPPERLLMLFLRFLHEEIAICRFMDGLLKGLNQFFCVQGCTCGGLLLHAGVFSNHLYKGLKRPNLYIILFLFPGNQCLVLFQPGRSQTITTVPNGVKKLELSRIFFIPLNVQARR